MFSGYWEVLFRFRRKVRIGGGNLRFVSIYSGV